MHCDDYLNYLKLMADQQGINSPSTFGIDLYKSRVCGPTIVYVPRKYNNVRFISISDYPFVMHLSKYYVYSTTGPINLQSIKHIAIAT